MKHTLVLAGALAVALSGTFAFAATLALAGSWVGTGSAEVGECDSNGFVLSHTLSGSNVVSVRIDDIADPGCENGVLTVRAVNAAGDAVAAGGPAAVPVDADTLPNSMTVPLTPNPAEALVAGFRIVVVGP